jgi:hypothetical protein
MIRRGRVLVLVLMTGAAPLLAAPIQERPSPPGTPVVKLIKAGAEPRQKLRYALAGEVDEKVQSTVQMAMATTLNGQPVSAAMGRVGRKVVTSVHAKPDASADLISFEYKVESCAEDPSDGEAIANLKPVEKALCTGVGASVGGVWTTRGILLESAIHAPPGASPQVASTIESISQSLRQMAVPLPAEPVGVGAEWEVSARMPMAAMPLDMTAHYKVLELGRSRLVAEITISQRLRPRNTEGAGKELQRLSALSAEGRGHIDVDLTHMAQVGDMQMTIRMETGSLPAGDAGVKGPMVFETTLSSSSTRL